jgi:plastocyanin domain-containing protein
MQSVTMPSFGVRKYVSEGDNIIEFTPDKSGNFDIVCSMGMGRQTFSVLGEDGKTGSVETQAVPSASTPSIQGGGCSMGAGCGCGGKL